MGLQKIFITKLIKLISSCLLLVNLSAIAQVPPIPGNEKPNPNRDRFPQPLPVPQPLPPNDTSPIIPTPTPTPTPEEPPISIPISKIEVTGSTVLNQNEIGAITKHFEGRSVTLKELRSVADSITQLYLSRGYITSRAILADQAIVNGVVKILVIEGANNYNNLKETPSILAFSLEKPGAIVNAAENLELSNKRLHLVLVGGTVVNTKPISLESISIATVLGQGQVELDYTYNSSLRRQIPRLEATISLPTNNFPTNWTRTPKSLPELLTSVPQLLTGGSAENANKLTVNSDGTVLLTGSGVQLQNGDVVLNGKVKTSFNSDSRYSSTSNSVDILAAGNVLAQDIEANGSGINISGASITVGNIQRTYAGGYSGFNNNQPARRGVNLNATAGNISAGNINTGGLSVRLSAQGGILASEIRTYRSDLLGNVSSVDLKAKTGNIQVGGIFAGSGGIRVSTPGTFRAIGTNTSGGSATGEIVVGKSPKLIEFLVRQGVARERLTGSNAKITVSSSARGNVVTSGSVNITHGGEARPTANGDRITITTIPGGSGLFDFVSGGFVPGSEGLEVERGNPQNFDSGDLSLRRIYREVNPLEIPDNVSVVAGIVTLDSRNQQLIGSLESRLFVPPPTPPGSTLPPSNSPPPSNNPPADNTPPPPSSNNNPLSETQQQTAQRQVNQQTNNSACNPSNTVVIAPKPTDSRTSDERSNTRVSSPPIGTNSLCNAAQDEQQILQILNESPNLDQNKKLYFDSSYPRFPDYAEQVTYKN